MSKDLTPEKARIFRIIHRDNMPWVFANGLHCRSSGTIDANYVGIGNPELIAKRRGHPVPCQPGGTLSDYVPFYFTPFSPMLYNIYTGYAGIQKRDNQEIVILVSSLPLLRRKNVEFLFTDRHAYLAAAQFHSDLAQLDQIDWGMLQQRDFKKNPDNPDRFERYQAEALVHKVLPLDALLEIVCYDDSAASGLCGHMAAHTLDIPIVAKPSWYF